MFGYSPDIKFSMHVISSKDKFQTQYHDVSELVLTDVPDFSKIFLLIDLMINSWEQKKFFISILPQSLQDEYTISHSETLVTNYFAF